MYYLYSYTFWLQIDYLLFVFLFDKLSSYIMLYNLYLSKIIIVGQLWDHIFNL